jgi:ABC-type uncharacterized transport system substrate-binding protein
MKKKITVLMLCAVLFALCAAAEAQQPRKVFRIGYLSNLSQSTDAVAEPFRAGLRELGYIEAQNIVVEYRYAEGKTGRQPELATELVGLKVDLIVVAGGTTPIRAAMKATKTIPIVMVGQGTEPVSGGIIASLARPGGNVTGITNLNTELGGKRLELLKEAVGKVNHVAVLYSPTSPGASRQMKEELPPAARTLKLTLQPWEIRAVDDFEKVFAALSKKRPDGLYALAGGTMRANGKRVAGLALKSRLPAVQSYREDVEAGALMYYGTDAAHSYRRVAYFVDKILKGAKPADLPVEQPTKFELVINLKTAKQISLTIPQSLLYKADKVIR